MARTIKSGILLTVGLGVGQGLSFIRNVVVAHFLAPDDFGMAFTFAITVSLVESLSDLAWDRMIVQAPDGDDDDLLSCAHFLTFVRGLLMSALVFALAPVIAGYYDSADAVWAYRCLAFVPLVRSLTHLERKRDHRRLEFRNDILTEVGAQAVGAGVGIFLAASTGHWSAMLWAIITQAVVWTLISRFVAKSKYRWCVSKSISKRFISFGWPLLINGFLIFGVARGDTVIIGGAIGMEAMGIYGVAWTLVFAPIGIVTRAVRTLFLPRLSASVGSGSQVPSEFRACLHTATSIALAVVTFYGLGGSGVIDQLYTSDYGLAGEIIPWLSLAGALQILRSSVTTAALSCGATKLPMIANLARSTFLVLLLVAAHRGWDIVSLSTLAVLGESLALATIAYKLPSQFGRSMGITVLAWAVVLALGFGAKTIESRLMVSILPITRIVIAVFGAIIVFLAALWWNLTTRNSLIRLVSRSSA